MTDPRLDAAMSRRRFLGGIGTTAAGLAGVAALDPRLRTGIGSFRDEAAASLGNVTLAFSWLFDVQQAGSYIAAKRGYYSPLNVRSSPAATRSTASPS